MPDFHLREPCHEMSLYVRDDAVKQHNAAHVRVEMTWQTTFRMTAIYKFNQGAQLVPWLQHNPLSNRILFMGSVALRDTLE
jgi:hypothetical protein